MTVALSGCDPPRVSKTWITKETKDYCSEYGTVSETKENYGLHVMSDGQSIGIGTKPTTTTRTVCVKFTKEVVDVHHAEVENSAHGKVTIRWADQEFVRPLDASHQGHSVAWAAQHTGSGSRVDPTILAPLTSLGHQFWVKMGRAMTETNKAMSNAIEKQGTAAAVSGQSFAAENFFMFAALAGRTLNGENLEVGAATRKYLADTYGIAGADVRTVMLGDPVQKPAPPDFGGSLPSLEPDQDAVKAQRAADRD